MARSRTQAHPEAQSPTGPVRKRSESAEEATGVPAEGPSPEALVASMAHGDEAALSEIYDRFSAALYSLALRVVGNDADAAEVTLDAFTHAWTHAASFDRSRSSVATWLCMLVRSRALDLLRRRRSRHERLDRAQAADPEAPALGHAQDDAMRAVEVGEKRLHIDEALSRLAPDQRLAIELAYFEGLSQSQIAERLGAPLGTIKTRIRTGMRTLRDILGPLYADDLA